MDNIGSRLRELRIKKGLKQNELAQMIGCSDKAISCYENNKNLDKIYDFKKICECLNADINYLITGIKNNNDKEISIEEKRIISAYYNLSNSDKRVVDFLLGIDTHCTNPNIIEEPTKIYRFPYYDQGAAAGVGQLGRDICYHMEDLTVDTIPDQASFVMNIVGESMYNEETDYIKNGSIAFINPKFEEATLNNKIVIVNFHGKIICKRYINKGNYVLFQSDNRQFENENRKSTDDPECKIIGIVLGVIENEKFIPVD